MGIIALGVALFSLASLGSLQLGDGRLMGPLGRSVAIGGYAVLGSCAYLLALGIGGISLRLLMERRPLVHPHEGAAFALGVVSLASLLHLAFISYRIDGYSAGGWIGETLAEVLRATISTAGTALLASLALLIAVVIVTPFRMRQVLSAIGVTLRWAGDKLRTGAAATGRGLGTALMWSASQLKAGFGHAIAFCGEVLGAILPERASDEYADEDEYDDELEDDPLTVGESEKAELPQPEIIEPQPSRPLPIPAPVDAESDATIRMDDQQISAVLGAEIGKRKTLPGVKAIAVADSQRVATPVQEAQIESSESAAEQVPSSAKPKIALVPSSSTGGASAQNDGPGPEIVECQFRKSDRKEMALKEHQAEAERKGFIKLGDGDYRLPPIHLLNYDDSNANQIDRGAMLEVSAQLSQALKEYGVKGEVTAIRPGPVVTMYEYAPAPGTRLTKITGLADDLAMALSALRVRIVAPIPGKNVVGFEVPNKSRETVYLKEIIADEVFQKSKSKLTMALGKDIDGAPVVVDLAKMPHLLVAGTTGSGKSVAVNSMITSLLYNASPEEVRVIMVDPKMLELSLYEGIPHLLLPVVTDPKRANLALRWAVEEMERRYDVMASMGVRDLNGFNKKTDKLRVSYEADALQKAADEARRRAEHEENLETTEERGQLDLDLEAPPDRLPHIVVIIDEFADLMMCAPKEVETSVARIAQKARAAGIHLILATQRPSVNVITGLIKANFPSRIAFRVSSKVDSRTILDAGGADALLGAGDMLFTDRGAPVRRVHGCLVEEDELHKIVDFLKTQGKPVYNMEILRPREDDEEASDDAADMDDMYDRAVLLVAEKRKVSISMIQRHLRVGYNRAARMVEVMERQGVVSPPDGTNRREVLIQGAA